MATYTSSGPAPPPPGYYNGSMLPTAVPPQNAPYYPQAQQPAASSRHPSPYSQPYPQQSQQYAPAPPPPGPQPHYPPPSDVQQAPFNYMPSAVGQDRLHPAEAYESYPPVEPQPNSQYIPSQRPRGNSTSSPYSQPVYRSRSAEPRRASEASMHSGYGRRGSRSSQRSYNDDGPRKTRSRRSSGGGGSSGGKGKSRHHSSSTSDKKPTMGDTAYLMYDSVRGMLGSRRH